ncbi:BON domain-containing protein [Aquincola sp. MAHUQ-54]|uniref:BON domain-containing protein n=1 Tax=Aquincola agrisoli TaxID=3119538 RepID=A0AAW9QF86_9BURK
MQTPNRTRLALVASAAALTLLAACSRESDDATVGQRIDQGIATTEQRTEQAANTAERKMEQAGDAIERGGEKVASATGDASLTAKVKTALITAPDLGSLKIDVDSNDGVVTLNGEVKTADEKARAERVVATVTGVTSVVNNLVVSS